MIKAVADTATGRLLGAQIVGPQGVDKRIDVLATAITFGATAADLFHLDLAYAPPYATTKDPVLYTGMALDNAITGRAPLITPAELVERQARGERLQTRGYRATPGRTSCSGRDSRRWPICPAGTRITSPTCGRWPGDAMRITPVQRRAAAGCWAP